MFILFYPDPGRPSEAALPPSQERYQLLVRINLATISVNDCKCCNKLPNLLQSKREWMCQYILKINRGLDLMEAVPLEDQERYLRRYLNLLY